MSELATRVASGVVMAAVALGALWAGGLWFGLLLAAAGLVMMAEWAGLLGARRWQLRVVLVLLALFLIQALLLVVGAAGQLVGGMMTVGIVPSALWRGDGMAPFLLLLLLLFALAALLTRRVGLSAGLLYVGLPVLGLLLIRAAPNGLAFALWTLAIVWATDIGAYFAGRAIGGPKLAPRLSPSKTWAGLGGGMFAAGIIGAAIAYRAHLPAPFLWIGGAMAVAAQGGDLFESWLKRRAGVKDSGRLLPGHGGVLDRLDGVVPVATLTAMLVASGVAQ